MIDVASEALEVPLVYTVKVNGGGTQVTVTVPSHTDPVLDLMFNPSRQLASNETYSTKALPEPTLRFDSIIVQEREVAKASAW